MIPEPFRDDARPVAAIFRSPVFNASETFVRLQAAGLSRYQTVVVGLEDKGHVPATLEGRVLLPAGRLAAFGVRAFGRWGGLADQVAATRPALIHAHFGTDGLIALPLARRLGIPLITTLRGYDVTRSRLSLLASGRLSWMRYAIGEQYLAAGGDLFLAVSDALREQAIARGFPAARILTHYNGVDLQRFRPAAGVRDAALVVHVGRLVEKKGTALLLQAIAGARRQIPDIRLVVCGDGPLRPALEVLTRDLGLADAVHFAGQVSPEMLAPLLQRAALLAAPSFTAASGDAEGLPNVVVEAAASGLPVVASDHGGIGEAVIEGETGFLVPEHAIAELEQRLTQLLGSTELRAKMGAAGRRLAETRFDAVRQMALLEQRYDMLRAAY
ncbi:MAG: glycosyltransferase [Candidatus Andeanibacterium colombiense]|uniref:Glycosyltransferase n=1 Tax=Candidatus Andeanibacterium colombiense TaxID=3121345 RepID=A0AAJ6BQT2_9SPHN|nr:MAG: glycosyltransferase [Sphingomonadaceae bacterium]